MTSFRLSNNFESTISDILTEVEFVRKGKKGYISNIPAVFDIEVSSFYGEDNTKQCTMYAWVFGINGKCIRGRFWWEFLDVINTLQKVYDLTTEKRFVIYVHNLAYEFQFMRKYFEWDKVFAVESRKPLYAVTKSGIEFRCSYLLSGYSLATLGNNLTKYKVQKLVGDLDYSLIRHSYTLLTDKEWGYILNDGLVVMAHIQEEIERLGSLAALPYTKTGYVRDLCRDYCFKGKDAQDFTRDIRKCTLSTQDYNQLKRAYAGGFTHANVYKVATIHENVSSFDFTSSYPAVMVSEKFPMGKAKRLNITTDCEAFRNALHKYCCMFDVRFTDIESTTPFENYISISKTAKARNYILNNGRIVEADEIIMTITEQDFFIIEKMYKWERMDICNFKIYRKEYLPRPIIQAVLDLFRDKTELKGVKGKEVEYLVAKGMINSVYGMCVTDPCKDEQLYDNEVWGTKCADTPKLIDRYNTNRARFLFYPWGVWVTAYSRVNLFSGILEFGADYIYSDTDSIKVQNADKHKTYFNEYNKNITKKIYSCLDCYGIEHSFAHPKTIKGVEKPIGVWDYEGDYTRFKTLGAKRYLVEKNGNIEITIAGVSKKAGKKYLLTNYKTLDDIFGAFTEHLRFPPHYDCEGKDCNGSGKLCHTYIDGQMSGYVVDYKGDNAPYFEESGVHLENTDYTLTIDESFKKLIRGVQSNEIL